MIKIISFKDDIINYPEYISFMYKTIVFNMKKILPDEVEDTDDSYKMWYSNNVIDTAKRPLWRTVIAFDDNVPCGYFQFGYMEKINAVLWGEMQIDDKHKGDHRTFRALIKAYLDDVILSKYEFVRGHINKRNKYSQSVFSGIGFEEVEETERGAKYLCTRKKIAEWYNVKV